MGENNYYADEYLITDEALVRPRTGSFLSQNLFEKLMQIKNGNSSEYE